MKLRINNAFFMAFVGLFLSLFAQKVSARDIILNLAFVDQMAIRQSDINGITDDLQEKYPNSEIVTLTAPAKRLGYLTNAGRVAARKGLTDKLTALSLSHDDKISMIVISTHGSSGSKKNEISLSHIGKVSDVTGPNKDLKDFFNPILPYIADDAKVVLDSCSTLCGTDKSSMVRAVKFLNFLGAHNGTIFGATTSIASDGNILSPGKKMTMIYLIAGLGLTEVHLFYSSAIGHNIFSEIHTPEGMVIKLLTNWAISAAIFGVLHTMTMPAYIEIASRIKLINFGKILNLRNGEVSNVQTTSYFFNKDEIFSKTQSCRNLFAN